MRISVTAHGEQVKGTVPFIVDDNHAVSLVHINDQDDLVEQVVQPMQVTCIGIMQGYFRDVSTTEVRSYMVIFALDMNV